MVDADWIRLYNFLFHVQFYRSVNIHWSTPFPYAL